MNSNEQVSNLITNPFRGVPWLTWLRKSQTLTHLSLTPLSTGDLSYGSFSPNKLLSPLKMLVSTDFISTHTGGGCHHALSHLLPLFTSPRFTPALHTPDRLPCPGGWVERVTFKSSCSSGRIYLSSRRRRLLLNPVMFIWDHYPGYFFISKLGSDWAVLQNASSWK